MEKEKINLPAMLTLAVGVTASSAVVILFLLFLVLSLVSPLAMARFTNDLGLYDQSAAYYAIQYIENGEEVQYIDNAFICASLAKNEEKVIEYGVSFIENDGFDDYCITVETAKGYNLSEKYSQYVYGRVACAYYRTGYNEAALELAFSKNQNEFDRYNAVTSLTLDAYRKGDKETVAKVAALISQMQLNGNWAVGSEDYKNVTDFLSDLNGYINK